MLLPVAPFDFPLVKGEIIVLDFLSFLNGGLKKERLPQLLNCLSNLINHFINLLIDLLIGKPHHTNSLKLIKGELECAWTLNTIGKEGLQLP